MAKVLACPACEHKHPLDLLVGLESFICKNCGRKLAVPPEANVSTNSLDQEIQKDSELLVQETPIKEELSLESDYVAERVPDEKEVVVLAHASLGLDQQKLKVIDLAADVKTNITTNKNISVDEKASKSIQDQKVLKLTKSPSGFFSSLADLSTIEIPFFARIVAWLFALPFGFFVVVLLPRFFKRGFHASDFVGVITDQGIGRYGIVITLIVLWSIATVIGILLFNLAFRKLFLQKRTLRSHP